MSTMTHLYSSRVAVKRVGVFGEDGAPSYVWAPVPELQYVQCRLDIGFLRPGKDIPMAVEAGKAPPRFGVLYAASNCGIRASDRITCVPNDFGALPVTGTFELRVPPDEAQDFATAHHIEVQVIEVALALLGERTFPGGSG